MGAAVKTQRLILLASIAFATSIGLPALAQEKDKTDETATRWFTLDVGDAYFEIEAQYDYIDVESKVRSGPRPRRRRQTNRESGFEERVGFDLAGSILDPRFINYRADLSFALAQNRFDERGVFGTRTDNDNGYLLEYNARMNFLQGKKFSGSVYGRRNDDRINRRFQPTLKQRTTTFGTSWTYAHAKLPMELSYDFRRTDRSGNRDSLDNEQYLDSVLRYHTDWNISDTQQLKVNYEHAETEQEYQGTRDLFKTTRDLFRVDHELAFGPEDKHTLNTRVRWQEESGDFARDIFEVGPELRLLHSKDFSTTYRYQFNRERYAGLDVETQRFDFQAVHQVYTNLTTTIDLFGLYEDVENDINTVQYGGSVNWQYNRSNRWGHLYANLSLAYDTEEVSGDDGQRIVLDESATFREPVDVRLRNRNVVFSSIVVTDSSNRRLYRPGIDYIVVRQGNVARLRRVRTGLIADGDSVLIDYQISTPQDGTLDTIRSDFSIEQRFTGGLTPYYRLSYRNQEDDVSSGFARRADRTDHHRLGLRYEQTGYTLGVEYEIFDDTVEPYDAFHINGLVHIVQRTDHTVDTSARFSRLLFEGGLDNRNVTMVDVELDHRWRLSRDISTIERVAYRYQSDSSRGITQGWDASAGVNFKMGQLEGELTLDYDRLDLPGSEENDFGVFFRIRRDFRNVLARR